MPTSGAWGHAWRRLPDIGDPQPSEGSHNAQINLSARRGQSLLRGGIGARSAVPARLLPICWLRGVMAGARLFQRNAPYRFGALWITYSVLSGGLMVVASWCPRSMRRVRRRWKLSSAGWVVLARSMSRALVAAWWRSQGSPVSSSRRRMLVWWREHADEPCNRLGEQGLCIRKGEPVVDRGARHIAQRRILRDRVAGGIQWTDTSPVLEIGHQPAGIVRGPRFIGRNPAQHLVKLIARGSGVNTRHRRLGLEPPPRIHHGPQTALGRIPPLDHMVQGLPEVIGRTLSEPKPTHICLGLHHQSGRRAKAPKHLPRPRAQLGPKTLHHHSGQARNQLTVGHIIHRTSVRPDAASEVTRHARRRPNAQQPPDRRLRAIPGRIVGPEASAQIAMFCHRTSSIQSAVTVLRVTARGVATARVRPRRRAP
jgi:hypothetical protein